MILFGKFAVALQCCHDVSSVINLRLSWLLSVTKIMWHSEDNNNNNYYYYYFNKVYNFCLLVVILESPVDQTCEKQQFLPGGGGGGGGVFLEICSRGVPPGSPNPDSVYMLPWFP